MKVEAEDSELPLPHKAAASTLIINLHVHLRQVSTPNSNTTITSSPIITMSSDLPMEIASTLQSASLKRDPSPSHDLNPSTTASEKIPVKVSHPKPSSEASYGYDTYSALDDADEIDSEDEIPEYVLRPAPRRHSFPPLPDLRFEQSYLASIKGLEEEGRWGRIAWITIRDQVRTIISPSSFLS